jgi:hypothetical protein
VTVSTERLTVSAAWTGKLATTTAVERTHFLLIFCPNFATFSEDRLGRKLKLQNPKTHFSVRSLGSPAAQSDK